jgi:hypothetical protein
MSTCIQEITQLTPNITGHAIYKRHVWRHNQICDRCGKESQFLLWQKAQPQVPETQPVTDTIITTMEISKTKSLTTTI